MNAIIEPDDIEISTIGDLLHHAEPFNDWPEEARSSLIRCFNPILKKRLDTMNPELQSYFRLFDESIANPGTERSNNDFLANIFKRFATYPSFWKSLWDEEAVWDETVQNFLREIGPDWNEILQRWSNDPKTDYPTLLSELQRAYREIGGNLNWKLQAPAPAIISKEQTLSLSGSSKAPSMAEEIIDLDDFREMHCELPEILKSDFHTAATNQNWKHCLEIVDEAQTLLLSSGLNGYGNGWQAFRDEALEWFSLIDDQISEHLESKEAVLLWFKLGVRCFVPGYANHPPRLHQHAVDSLVKEAQKHIGLLRKDIREKGSGTDFTFYSEVVDVLRAHSSWWQCIKPLLLAFREFKEPAVAPDLRFRPERKQQFQPPELASQLARWIANLLANPSLKTLRDDDPTLKNIREEFASFCISRLKTKDEGSNGAKNARLTNDSFMEPNPIWRSCYARAALELRINPRGTSHRLALWSSQNDPDAEVRDSALKLYESLRHQKTIDTKLSPRRPLMAAYWWIRQAHLRSLSITIDKRGAQRTRSKDLRWTERIDSANQPKKIRQAIVNPI